MFRWIASCALNIVLPVWRHPSIRAAESAFQSLHPDWILCDRSIRLDSTGHIIYIYYQTSSTQYDIPYPYRVYRVWKTISEEVLVTEIDLIVEPTYSLGCRK